METNENQNHLLDFKQSDASLIALSSIINVLKILLIIATVIIGIVCFISSPTASGIIIGAIVIVVGIVSVILLYRIFMVLIWAMYDIKVIRNACTNSEWSIILNNFHARL